jgi:hypothetical protein
VEVRPGGAVLVTAGRGAPWPVGAAGLAAGTAVLGATLAGGAGLLGAVLTLPAGVILLLAGWAALRHRDWVLVDPRGRQVLHRRGLRSMFRAIGVLAFEDVAAIRVGPGPGGSALVHLRCADGALWPLWAVPGPGPAAVLAAAVRGATGWPVEDEGAGAAPGAPAGTAGGGGDPGGRPR